MTGPNAQAAWEEVEVTWWRGDQFRLTVPVPLDKATGPWFEDNVGVPLAALSGFANVHVSVDAGRQDADFEWSPFGRLTITGLTLPLGDDPRDVIDQAIADAGRAVPRLMAMAQTAQDTLRVFR